MESWLILIGVLLPFAPLLQFAEARLDERNPRPSPVPVPVPAKNEPAASRG